MGSSKEVTVGYKYSIGIHMVLCHGPIDKITAIESDGKTAWSGTQTGGTISIDNPGLFGGESREGGIVGDVDIEMGETTQGQNSYLLSQLGSLVPSYRGVVSAILNQVYIGLNPYLKRWAFWGQRIHVRGNGSPQWYDTKAAIGNTLNPAHILRECITDLNWGMGYPEAEVDDVSFTAAADQLVIEQMGISLLWDKSTDIEEFVQLILKHIDGSLFVHPNTGLYTLKLIRADYDPDTLLTLDENSVEKITNFKRSTISELINTVTVIYWDEATGKDNSVTVQDIAMVAKQGATISTTKQLPGFTNGTIASRAASRILKSLSVPLASASIYANRTAANLNIGDVFKLSWGQYGLVQTIMRVANVEFGSLTSNIVRLSVVEDVFGLGEQTYAAPPPSGWTNPINDPLPCPYHSVMEAPYWDLVKAIGETEAQNQELDAGYVLATGVRPTSDAIDAEIYSNPTGTLYEEKGEADFCPTATLAENIGPTQKVFAISNGIDLDIVNVGTYCVLNGELMAVDGITDTQLTVKRGVLDTTPTTPGRFNHLTGDRIFFPEIFHGSDKIEYVNGDTARIKVLPTTGKGTLDVTLAPEKTVVIAARQALPYPPQQFKIDSQDYPTSKIGDFTVSWAHRDRLQQTVNLVGADAASIGPEIGTSYTVTIKRADNDAILDSNSGISGTSKTVLGNDINYSGPIAVQLNSQRDLLTSWQTHENIMDYIPSPMVVSSPDNPDDFVENGTALTVNYDVTPGQSPFTWTVDSGAIPTGMSLDVDTGTLSGTPTVDATYNFTIKAVDNQGFFDTEIFEIKITSQPMILGTAPDSSPLANYTFDPYTINVDPPTTWSITLGALPDNLTVDSSTGQISGVVGPTEQGDYTFTLEADGSAIASREFTINISGQVGEYRVLGYVNNLFVLSLKVTPPGETTQTWFVSSADNGATWTMHDTPEGTGISFNIGSADIAYSNAKYIIGSSTAGTWYGISSNLVTWTNYRKTDFPDAGVAGGIEMNTLINDGTQFVSAGRYGIVITTTTGADANDWVEVPSNTLVDTNSGPLWVGIFDMVFDGITYFCIFKREWDYLSPNYDEYQVWKSTDLVTWTKIYEKVETDTNGYQFYELKLLNGRLFLLGDKNNTQPICISTNDGGTTWIDHSPAISAVEPDVNVSTLIYFNGKYILYNVDNGGIFESVSSTDLTTWTKQTLTPINNDVYGMVNITTNGINYIVGELTYFGGTLPPIVIESTDGINWNEIDPTYV